MHPLASVVTNAPLSGPRAGDMPGGRVPSSRSWESGKSRGEVGDGAHDDAPAEGWGRNAHRMGTFNVVVNLVLVVAALVTVWFAWQASKEGAELVTRRIQG